MPKSPAERKAAQRKRQQEQGIAKMEFSLDAQEVDMLDRNRKARRPGKDSYDREEYIQMLIRQDDARMKLRFKSLSRMSCGRCGDSLPVSECCMSGDSGCWVTNGWRGFVLA
ncbi:hypothetical protein [Pectobacterium versatile]|uniref:hypothetical protein n=1 Tax=Pectobacterium versatile TaxID=2488639 RepID=UPI00102EC6CE|nr:hypothetical protein [Pectobacterium versatile]TAI99820.1 hypothetical protein EG332_04220 [Pectobacterium versatile]UEQ10472.1 hypothetical protein LLE50_05005 [Pectobacterium versatile]GKX40048.1 hypothetical protein SOASR014_37870 [Pectobacterium carotovorum subsp. carotovorum]GLX46163.1 hypothetical protein Pcaca01_38310 [Pectobacterium carotovorum subsp. carotovorum]